MALGTPVINSGGKSASAPVFVDELVIALDASYPTGGYALDLFSDGNPESIGAGRTALDVTVKLRAITGKAQDGTNHGYWNPSTKKLMVYDFATNAEKGAASNLATIEAVVVAYSK